jgi:hypothetical protein
VIRSSYNSTFRRTMITLGKRRVWSQLFEPGSACQIVLTLFEPGTACQIVPTIFEPGTACQIVLTLFEPGTACQTVPTIFEPGTVARQFPQYLNLELLSDSSHTIYMCTTVGRATGRGVGVWVPAGPKLSFPPQRADRFLEHIQPPIQRITGATRAGVSMWPLTFN